MPTSALKASRPERSPLPNGTTLKLRSLDTENELTLITKCTITGLLSKEGGSGLVYEATDDYNTTIKGKERNLIIKECYPLARVEVGGSEKSLASLLIRDPKSNELAINEDLEESWKLEATKVFEDYKQHFKDAFNWHSINAADAQNHTAPLLGFSEENNTVYIISSRQEGHVPQRLL